MDQLDREIAEAFTDQPLPQGPAQILIIGSPTRLRSKLVARLTERRHHCVCAAALEEGRAAVNKESFDLVLLDLSLSDGRSIDFAGTLQSGTPSPKIIVMSTGESFQHAIEALRSGVTDFVDPKMPLDDIVARIEKALGASRADNQKDKRLAQLKLVCKKLVDAREEVSAHLDQLCQDLVTAYQDVSEQMSEVAMAAEFRTLLKQELDVEELLRTALEYLLTKTGPTNAAVFLPDGHGNFELGAYVNYDCPRETITVLLNHLCRAVCPQMIDESEIVSFDDAAAFAEWVGADAGFLTGCQVVALSCSHEGKCMAVMVLFRSKDEPFEEALAVTIDILRSIFAEQVAHVIRVHHRANPSWPKDPLDDEYDASDYDDLGFGDMVA